LAPSTWTSYGWRANALLRLRLPACAGEG